jgi:glycosyltransferase involved in cell wall biosynthesis
MGNVGTIKTAARRFSVVVPSFQQGEFLERSLQSIFSQDDPNVEVIVQDGGSTDQSVGILERYAGRVRWESKHDEGQAAAMNEGLQKASGEYLCCLNSDDVFYPGAFHKVREFFDAHPEAMVAYGLADFIDEQDRVIAAYPVEPWNYGRLLETCFVCQPSCFFRRAVLERFGLFDRTLRYAMDYDYWLRVGAVEPFHFLCQKLAASRYHGSAKTFSRSRDAHREAISVLRRYHHGRIPPRWIVAYARHCGEDQLREGGALPMRWAKFAFSYWINLLRLAPFVTPDGMKMLLHKLGPPYPSACQRQRGQLEYLERDLIGQQGGPANSYISAHK